MVAECNVQEYCEREKRSAGRYRDSLILHSVIGCAEDVAVRSAVGDAAAPSASHVSGMLQLHPSRNSSRR